MAPVGQQTEVLLSAAADATLFAGANSRSNFGASQSLTVSTANGTAHDATAVALLRFDLAGQQQPPSAVLTAVLELTFQKQPAETVLVTVVGVAGNPAWDEGAPACCLRENDPAGREG